MNKNQTAIHEASISDAIRGIYAATGSVYEKTRECLGSHDLGFKILYGPPFYRAPVLFVGDQPGGRVKDEKPTERWKWPSSCEYATKGWLLARQMKAMFGPVLLQTCVGINANFFRAPDAETWRAIPQPIRHLLKQFCNERLEVIITLIDPVKIVVIGFSKASVLGTPVLTSEAGRILMRECMIGGRAAEATLHLSGARISAVDRRAIARRIEGE